MHKRTVEDRRVCGPIRPVFVALARDRERVAENGLGDQSVGALRQPVAEPKLDIHDADLEIGDREDCVLLLLQRQEIADLTEVIIILGPIKKSSPSLRASRSSGRKSVSPPAPKLTSTIGLAMNSQSVLRHPMIGRISSA
jgi:hypothetical protein